MTKRAIVLINSFKRKSRVHPVISKYYFVKIFKTPLCKMGELVMAYDVKASNKTLRPIAFYALYIGSNDGSTGHSVLNLSTKSMIVTPR